MAMFEDSNVYQRVSENEYKPIGIQQSSDILYDGLWLVHHHEHSRGITSMDYIEGIQRIGPAIEPDLSKIAGLYLSGEKIMALPEFQEMIRKGCSVLEIVNFVIGHLYKEGKNEKII